MRYKRTDYFKKMRRKKARKLFLLAVVMPAMLVLLGYLVASVIILPSMSG
jgi:phage shock protein PspC (stress-responsive transcriptional regulator)